ncbi:MAG TPA: SCP2 sterol-binding domain-containing protein [Vicinamibacterales bacterium]
MSIGSARAFFEALRARAHQPRLVDAVGTWQFEIEGVGTWTVAVDHGALTVTDVSSSRPAEGVRESNTRLRLREDELLRLVRGDRHENLFMGVIRGAIVVEGELAFAQRLQTLLPLPDERSAQA